MVLIQPGGSVQNNFDLLHAGLVYACGLASVFSTDGTVYPGVNQSSAAQFSQSTHC